MNWLKKLLGYKEELRLEIEYLSSQINILKTQLETITNEKKYRRIDKSLFK